MVKEAFSDISVQLQDDFKGNFIEVANSQK